MWKGIYHIIPFEDPAWKPSPWLVAQYLCQKKDGHIFYFTALEAQATRSQGIFPQKEVPSKSIYIQARKKSTAIEKRSYDGYTYILYKKGKKLPGIEEFQVNDLKTGAVLKMPGTDAEETFLECLQRIEQTLARIKTGLELVELFRKANLDFSTVIEHIEKHNSLVLNSKAGLILELLDEEGRNAKLL
jgi:hypothetical protein